MVSPAAMILYMKKDRPMMSGLICTMKLELNYLAILLSACTYSV